MSRDPGRSVNERLRGRLPREILGSEPTAEVLDELEQALQHAAAEFTSNREGILPADAWVLANSGKAVLVDVRTAEERKFVGHVPGSAHVAWMLGTAMVRNPRFLREMEATVSKDSLVLLLCRSGKRSAAAVESARAAGFTHAYNVIGGFEGDLDEFQQRGRRNGWRHFGLPWVQD
jgi:rhodanese-related sulfurtransferase